MTIKKILEGYVDTFKHKKKTIEILVNPSPQERRSVSPKFDFLRSHRTLRFIACPALRKVYVFTPAAFHVDVAEYLKHKKLNRFDSLWGTAIKSGGKWIMDGSDTLYSQGIKSKHLKRKWEWADRYVVITPFIEKMKKSGFGKRSTYPGVF